MEYFDIYCEKIVKLADWVKTDTALLVKLLKRDTLNIAEVDLFDAVVRWGKVKSGGKSGDELAAALKDVLPHVRFPCMAVGDIASRVAPTGLLTSEQQLTLFTYAGSKAKDDSKAVGGDKLQWLSRERVGRRPPNWFNWDPNRKGHGIALVNENMTATTNAGANWNTVYASAEIADGAVAEWELVLEQYDTSNSYNVVIGIAPATHNNYTHQSLVGYDANQSPGWAFVTGNGQKINNNTQLMGYGTAANYSGCVVRCKVDLKKHTFELWVNGQHQGVAFQNVYGPVRPAISLTQAQRVTLRFPKPGSAAAAAGAGRGGAAKRGDSSESDDEAL